MAACILPPQLLRLLLQPSPRLTPCDVVRQPDGDGGPQRRADRRPSEPEQARDHLHGHRAHVQR